jgi:thioredoxin-related protein
MKYVLLCLLTLTVSLQLSAQQKITIYNPEADARKEIDKAVQLAAAEGKQVFLQIGGNWCSWCLRFHKMVEEDRQLDSLLKADYVVVKVNFSKENQNNEVLASLDYPQRFGFPVFVILDGKGKRIHTQDSSLLEQDKGYSKEKIQNMLLMWSADAIRKTAEKYKPGAQVK